MTQPQRCWLSSTGPLYWHCYGPQP